MVTGSIPGKSGTAPKTLTVTVPAPLKSGGGGGAFLAGENWGVPPRHSKRAVSPRPRRLMAMLIHT